MNQPNEWRKASNPPGLDVKAIAADLSLSERLAYATARLECWDATGTGSVGTSFFVDFVVREKDVVPVLVTNKHVVEGARSGRLRLHGADAAGSFNASDAMWVSIQNFEDLWINHPDPDVDLCVFPVASLIKDAAVAKLRPAIARINVNAIATDADTKKMDMVEEVLMVGYPNGIWDDHNGLPIMRRGVTATHVAKDFKGRKEFLIDVCTIPGSSGSPIFRYRRSDNVTDPRDVKLLGIVCKVFTSAAEGEIVETQIPTNSNSVVLTPFPINLGIVIRATRLFDFADELERRSRSA